MRLRVTEGAVVKRLQRALLAEGRRLACALTGNGRS
jgi:hypothetical protein